MYVYLPVEIPLESIRFLLEPRTILFILFLNYCDGAGQCNNQTCNQLVFLVFETEASKGIPQGKYSYQNNFLLSTPYCAPWTKKIINHECRFCFKSVCAIRWRLGMTAEFMLLLYSY